MKRMTREFKRHFCKDMDAVNGLCASYERVKKGETPFMTFVCASGRGFIAEAVRYTAKGAA